MKYHVQIATERIMVEPDLLTEAEFNLLEAKYPGKCVSMDFEVNYYRIYVDDECVAKEITLPECLKEALA